jgi:quercetin dioxygenase-like cupin family protein
MNKPYKDVLYNNLVIREFDKNINSSELKWHRDKYDREITILEGEGWYIQFENSLPFEIKKGDVIFINKHEYHRVIKGKTKLKIQIYEITRTT